MHAARGYGMSASHSPSHPHRYHSWSASLLFSGMQPSASSLPHLLVVVMCHRLGRHCRLQRDDVMHLLTTTLPQLKADKFLTLLETLEGIRPHQCLTAEDVMQLLPQIARYR